MTHPDYTCPKCGNKEFETDEFRATGGRFAKMFDVQNKKFRTVSCINCGYTEIFKKRSSKTGNVIDFLFGS